MAAALNPATRARRPGANLKAPARAVLQQLATAGPQTRQQLVGLLGAFDITGTAREACVWNLQSMGYTERVNVASVVHWQLTALGRRAVGIDTQAAPPPAAVPAPAQRPAQAIVISREPLTEPEPPPGARTVVWASRRVALPNAPRSVFDLGGLAS